MAADKERYYSVVMPLYNKKAYVARSIRSVLDQTHRHVELIVVDDGSTDDSAQVVSEITDTRIRLIVQTNQGVSAARNKGIDAASHEMVAFLDADDWWDKDYLFHINELVDKYPDVSIFGAKHAIVRSGGIARVDRYFDDEVSDLTFDLIEFGAKRKGGDLPINASNLVIRKSILGKSGCFDIRIHFYEDYDLFLRMGVFSQVAYLNRLPLSFYNHDVPLENRANGRAHPIESHLIYHLGKFDEFYKLSPYLSIYLDRFKLEKLIPYMDRGAEFNVVKEMISSVDRGLYTWREKLYYSNRFLCYLVIRVKPVYLILKRVFIRNSI